MKKQSVMKVNDTDDARSMAINYFETGMNLDLWLGELNIKLGDQRRFNADEGHIKWTQDRIRIVNNEIESWSECLYDDMRLFVKDWDEISDVSIGNGYKFVLGQNFSIERESEEKQGKTLYEIFTSIDKDVERKSSRSEKVYHLNLEENSDVKEVAIEYQEEYERLHQWLTDSKRSLYLADSKDKDSWSARIRRVKEMLIQWRNDLYNDLDWMVDDHDGKSDVIIGNGYKFSFGGGGVTVKQD